MPSDLLRVAFAGTPEFAATSLKALIESRHLVVRVLSQPDRPQGRGRKLIPSPVKACAIAADIPVQQPERLDAAAIADLQALGADLLIVVAYGLILPRPALDACRLGAINVHASLLPRWRGAAPIQRAIQAGDSTTGITIMQMDEGLDTGAMLAKSETEILATDTGGTLHDRLAEMGAELLIETLNQVASNDQLPPGDAQTPEAASYAHKLSKAEAAIDWSQPATSIDRMVRAFHPWPVAYTQSGEPRIRILQAHALPNFNCRGLPPGALIPETGSKLLVACGDGALHIEQLQFAGGKPINAREALNGHAELFGPAVRLGSQ